ncbi:MAG: hypothetical protein M1281_18490 [Chloroflexi bacterium]|nr:hypothetical protein [Chloroflexota bacterium]
MQRKTILSVIAGGALVLVVAFGAITYSLVSAQASTPTPTTPTAPSIAGRPGYGHGGGGVTDQELANALGVSLEQLQTAQQTANSQALGQAVAEGLITQNQADQYPQEAWRFIRGSDIDYNALLAKALGITTGQLAAANQTACNASLDQAVQDGILTQAQADAAKGSNALSNDSAFQSAMKSAFETAVNAAVTQGVISQAQADTILNQVSSMGGWFGPGGFGGPGGRGGPGGHGGPGGPGGWSGGTSPSAANPANPTPASPSATPGGSGL